MTQFTSKSATRAIAWVATLATAMSFALPVAAFQSRGNTSSAKWVSQMPGAQAGGATVVNANPGDVLNFSLTVQNTSATDVFYSADALLDEPAPYVGAHEMRIGATGDTVYDNIFDFSYGGPFVNNNRFATFQSGPAVFPGGLLTFNWSLKVKPGIANGTYRFKVGAVQEYDAWLGDRPGPGAGGPNNNLGGRLGGTIFWDIVVGGTGTGSLNIASTGSPAAGNAALGAVDVVGANLNFSASSTGNALINSITIRRAGLADDNDTTDVKLYDGATKIGSTQGWNTTTHKATFSGLSWLIPAGTTKTLTVKFSVNTSGNGGTTGNVVQVGIESAADVVLTGTGTIGGSFPAYGNGTTIAGITVGQFDVDVQGTPAATNLVAGATDQAVASWKFSATSTEGFSVQSVTFTEIGTSVDSDISNLKLKINGTQVGGTVAALSNGSVTFSGTPLFSVAAGQNQQVYLFADISSGVTSQRTVRFEITDSTKVTANGQNSGGIVTTTYSNGTAFVAQQGAVMTIVQGNVTVTLDPTNLSAQTYIVGETQVELAKLKFSAGSREGLKVTKIKFTEDDDATATDYQNARLYINDSATPITVSGSIGATTVLFEDGAGLFTVPASGNTVVTLKVDITTSASAGDSYSFGVDSVTDLEMWGITSNAKIDSTASNITLTGVGSSAASIHEIAANGTLVFSNGTSTPPAANYAKGSTDFEFLQFRAAAGSEAMRMTSLIVRFYDNNAVDYSDAAATGDVTNVKLYMWNGTTWTQLGTESASPTGGVASFSFDTTIAKNTTGTFKVTGNIPTTSAASYLYAGITDTGAGDVSDDTTTTGVSSGANITETGSSDGSLFTMVAPTITAAMSTVPATRTVVVNSTGVVLGRLFLTANAVEPIRVSTLRISADDTAISGNGGTSAANTTFSNVRLGVDTNGDGTYDLTTTSKQFTDGTPDFVSFSGSDFNAPTNWNIPSGGSLVVDILGDVVGNSGSWSFGMVDDDPQTSIVGAGVNSGTSATISGLTTAITSSVLTLTTGGSLAITAATDTPVVQQVTASYGSTVMAPAFTRVKFVATNEAIRLERVRVTTSADGVDDNFASASGSVKVYEGGTIVRGSNGQQMLSGGTLVGTGTFTTIASAADETDVTLSPQVTIAQDATKYLTFIANLNSIADGADSGDVPRIGLDESQNDGNWDTGYSGTAHYNVRAVGVSSGTVIYTASSSADLLGNAAYVVKTQLGLNVNSASPSGTATRQAAHTIFKLNATNSSADTDARFRAGLSKDTADATGWSAIGSTTVAADATNYITTGSAKFSEADLDAADGMQQDMGDTTTLDDYTRVSFWVRVSGTGTAAGDLTFVIDDATGLATTPMQTISIPALAAATWVRVDAALSGVTGARYFGVLQAVDVLTTEAISVDNVVFYHDSLKTVLSSNAGLFATSGATNTAVTLKDGNGTTLATGYVSGTGTGGLSTSSAEVTFIPTTEITVPASGKIFNIVADTTVLITATSKNLSMSVDLGSASTTGTITAGGVLWNDNSSSTTIGWVDALGGDNPLSRGLNF